MRFLLGDLLLLFLLSLFLQLFLVLLLSFLPTECFSFLLLPGSLLLRIFLFVHFSILLKCIFLIFICLDSLFQGLLYRFPDILSELLHHCIMKSLAMRLNIDDSRLMGTDHQYLGFAHVISDSDTFTAKGLHQRHEGSCFQNLIAGTFHLEGFTLLESMSAKGGEYITVFIVIRIS